MKLSQNVLYQEIASCGWELRKIKYDKNRDLFTAEARSTQGDELSGFGNTQSRALNDLLRRIQMRNRITAKTSRWSFTFTDQLAPIARAYSKAPVYEPNAANAFMALARDSKRRARAIANHLQIEVVNNPEPYESAEKMHEDVRKRRRILVSQASIDHPIWSAEEVLDFRIAFDVLGYASASAGFDWEGTNEAFAHYVHLLPIEAQKALFSEVIAPSAYAIYYRAYGPQKIALFPQFMDPAQEQENPHKGYPGIHPDTVEPPIPVPAIKHEASMKHEAAGKLVVGPAGPIDPNYGWSSGVTPMQTPDEIGDPLDIENAREVASRLVPKYRVGDVDVEWAYLNQNDPQQLAVIKEAVINAIRVAILSVHNKLHWNMIQYQHLRHIPIEESDPQVFYDAHAAARTKWNTERFGNGIPNPPIDWAGPVANILYQRDPYLGREGARKAAERKLLNMHERFQEKARAQLGDDAPNFKVEFKANNELRKYIRSYVAESKAHALRREKATQPGVDIEAAQEEPDEEAQQDTQLGPDKPFFYNNRYGTLMSMHLIPLAQIGEHADELAKAALEDVHEHDGTGWHFRSTLLQIVNKYNIKYIGPKVASFAWLFLAPLTSELATVDTHIMNILGYKTASGSPTNRDYFRMERELRSRTDAAGYNDVNLGLRQYAIWDYFREGPGTHQDHTPGRALNPTPWDDPSVVWHQPVKTRGMYEQPDWWAATEPYGEQTGADYENTVSPFCGNKNDIPLGIPNGQLQTVLSKTSAFRHPETNELIPTPPGDTKMNQMRAILGLSPMEIWNQIDDSMIEPEPVFAYGT